MVEQCIAYNRECYAELAQRIFPSLTMERLFPPEEDSFSFDPNEYDEFFENVYIIDYEDDY